MKLNYIQFNSLNLFQNNSIRCRCDAMKLVEMDRIQHSLKQLQEAHIVMKQQYEDEIVRLRHKLDIHPLSKGDPDGRGGVRARLSPCFSVAGVFIFLFFVADFYFPFIFSTRGVGEVNGLGEKAPFPKTNFFFSRVRCTAFSV